MENHWKSAPRAGDVVELVYTREVWIRDEKASRPKPGKMNYLGGPAADRAKAASRKKRRIVIKTRSLGRYIGDGKRLIAFVTVDAEETDMPFGG
jgi:hypothetical protein